MPHIKEAYYFSHDSNARHDPNICDMRFKYGMEGYGMFWVIVEMLREQSDYMLSLAKINAIAMQAQCTTETAQQFINDCINNYHLFKADGEYFWSDSLLRRMKTRAEKTEQARQAARSRWQKTTGSDASAMHSQCARIIAAEQTQCDSNAIKVKESKEKESKENKSTKDIFAQPEDKLPGSKQTKKTKTDDKGQNGNGKSEQRINYREYVRMTPEQHQKLQQKYGPAQTEAMLDILDNYKGSRGRTYKDDCRAIESWVVRRYNEDRMKGVHHGQAGQYPGREVIDGSSDLHEFIQNYDSGSEPFPEDDDMH